MGNNNKSKKDPLVKDEPPAFVPRYIALKFMAIDEVTDVKPSRNDEDWLKVIVIPREGGYNRELLEKIGQAEHEIEKALKSRNQKFEASVSW